MRKALSLRHTWRTLPLLVKAQHAIRGATPTHVTTYTGLAQAKRHAADRDVGRQVMALVSCLCVCGCVGAGLFEPRNGFDDVWLEAREVPLPDGEKAQSVACSGALTAVLTGVSPLHACRTHVIHRPMILGRERLTGPCSPLVSCGVSCFV